MVFFFATQTISGRDIVAAVVGCLLGAIVAALISTWVFHADRRKNAQAAEVAAAQVSAVAEAERLKDSAELERETLRVKAQVDAETVRVKAQADADAIRIQAEANADATRTRADADAALTHKRTELLTSLPTRQERLAELYREIALTQQNRTTAKANAEASRIQARESLEQGFRDDAAQQKGPRRTGK